MTTPPGAGVVGSACVVEVRECVVVDTDDMLVVEEGGDWVVVGVVVSDPALEHALVTKAKSIRAVSPG